MQWPGEFNPSPNREPGNNPSHIILHGSGGSEKGSESWITQPKSQVSYHFFIGKNDRRKEDVTQFVVLSDKAWHAGRSRWGSLKGMNAHSIGIGLESMNKAGEVYPENQLILCQSLCHWLMDRLSIPISNILTHKMISDPVGRKTDPVNFPYGDFIRSMTHPGAGSVKVEPLLTDLENLRHFDVAADGPDVYRGRIEKARRVGDKLYIRHWQEEE
jgi:N-acetyl-anhydromuramyl-L-alanine amidase AmpD